MTHPAGLPAVYGHEELLGRIRASISSQRFPQSLLLHGGVGVGKRTVALWMAAVLHCEGDPAPCGVWWSTPGVPGPWIGTQWGKSLTIRPR